VLSQGALLSTPFAGAYHQSKLADNMTIDENEALKNGVVMQVNKYIPHYQRIPSRFEKEDFRIFSIDEEDDSERYLKLKPYIEEFDKKMIDSLMLDREMKYKKLFGKQGEFSSSGS